MRVSWVTGWSAGQNNEAVPLSFLASRLLYSDVAAAASFCQAVGLDIVDNSVVIPKVGSSPLDYPVRAGPAAELPLNPPCPLLRQLVGFVLGPTVTGGVQDFGCVILQRFVVCV